MRDTKALGNMRVRQVVGTWSVTKRELPAASKFLRPLGYGLFLLYPVQKLLHNAEQQELHGPAAKSHLNLGYQVALCEHRGATRLILVHKPANKVGEGEVV